MNNKIVSKNNPTLFRMVQTVAVVATGWVFSEWLFFVTKPSFISPFSWIEKIEVLCSSALIITGNFTLTLFGWGIRNSSGAAIWVYRVATVIMALSNGKIPGSSMDCETDLSVDEVREMMYDHLKQRGYSWQ
jgi:hypothetical protein